MKVRSVSPLPRLLNVFGAEVLAIDDAKLFSVEGGLALAAFETTLVVGLIIVENVLFRRIDDHSTALKEERVNTLEFIAQHTFLIFENIHHF